MKNIKQLLIASALVIFNFSNIEAMSGVESQRSENSVNSKNSLSALPIVHPFSPEAETDVELYKTTVNTYISTWDETVPLKKNQENLVDRFLNECCDLSFKLVEQINEIHIGRLDSREQFAFCDEADGVAPDRNSEGILIFAKSGVGITVPSWRIPTFLEGVPRSFTDEFRNKLRETLLELVQNPVGAKLLRVSIAKRSANHMPKLVFVPIHGTDVSLEAGNSIQRYLAKDNQEIADYLSEMKERFVLYNPECLSDKDKRVIRYDSQLDKCFLDVQDVPFKVSLFNVLNRSLYENYNDTAVLLQYSNGNIHSVPFIKEGKLSVDAQIPNFRFKRNIYENDSDYRSMLGRTSSGIDLLCEAAYTSGEYKYIRMSSRKYASVRIKGIIGEHTDEIRDFVKSQKEINLTRKQLDALLSQYIENGEDHEIFKDFLKLQFKSPKFGIGQYKCADLNPKTGDKLSSVGN